MGVNVNHSCWNARLSTTPWALNIDDFGQCYQLGENEQLPRKETEGNESESCNTWG